MAVEEVLEEPGLKDVLAALSSRNIKLWAADEQLHVRAPRGALTPELRSQLARYKAELLAALRADAADVATAPAPPLVAVARDGAMPLSYAQQRLWFMHQFEDAGVAYNLPLALRLRGRLDVEALRWSFDALVRRHEILRTTFAEVNGAPAQVVARTLSLDLPVFDLRREPSEGKAAAVRRLMSEEARLPFDLSQCPLLRVRLLRVEEDEFVLLVTMHHIITDGWSMSVLVREFSRLYQSYVEGAPETPEPLAVQYADFARWQREWLRGETLSRKLDFWKKYLDGAPPLLNLPTDRPRPPAQSFDGAAEPVFISQEVVERLLALGQREGATLFMVLLAAFNVLLARYCGQSDIVVGSSIANRTTEELEGLIGFFVNSLALRTDLSGEPTFRELLARVRRTTLAAYEHQDVPFQLIVEELQQERSLSHAPVFQVMFDLQNMPAAALTLPGLSIEPVAREGEVAKFELTLALRESPQGLQGVLEYSTALFDRATAGRMAAHFERLLRSIAAAPESKIGRLRLLTDDEYRAALVEWNDTEGHYPAGRRVHRLFEQQAERTPHAVAASCDGARLSYLELNAKANQVANALRARGVATEAKVALFLERGFDYLIAMLGVLKAGGAFVPLDPQVSDHLSQVIVEECRPALVLSTRDDGGRVAAMAAGTARLCVEDVYAAGHSSAAPPEKSCPNSLAYVIYTSGSTGKPKGVMIEHEGMVNHIFAHVNLRKITASDVVGQIAKQTFDVSVWQFLCALMVGGRTAIITGESAWEPSQLLPKMMEEGVTILQSVPSHTNVILDEMEANPGKYRLTTLRYYMTHAEALSTGQCARWFRNNPGVTIINGYGATEVSDDSSHLLITEPPSADAPYMPIHGVITNLKHYVLDEALNPAPVGVCGEMYIGGVGVGRGYLNDPSRTAAVFVPDPYSREPGARLYRVGDLGKYRPDGAIEFAGRTDFQIRVRGFRVEIGEIETALARHPKVKQCVVVPKQDERGVSYLIGYVVPVSHPAPSHAQLEAHLAGLLPDYMIPSHFVYLDAFPLSSNGKVARKNLPLPSQHDLRLTANYVPPSNQTEARLAELWGAALGVERVGVRDNFFQLGGHSLLAAELVIKMRAEFDAAISLRSLFEAPTIESFLRKVDRQLDFSPEMVPGLRESQRALAGVGRFPAREYYELAPAQIPVWYACTMAPESNVYNVNYRDLSLAGKLDLDCFVRAWQTFFERHTAFRLRFAYRDGRPVQYHGPEIVLRAEEIYVDRRDVPRESRKAEVTRLEKEFGHTVFDLANGPLFRLKVVDYGDDQYQVLFVTHHIIWDESSLMNAFQEISELYNSYLTGRPPQLPDLNVEYTDYVQWIHEAVSSGAFAEHRRYWLDMYRQLPPALDLATDFPRPAVQTYNGAWVYAWLPRNTARKLSAYLLEHNVTLFMFMLAVLDLYLYRITGQDDLVIGCPIDGRDHEHFKPLVGLFATPMPIRCRMQPGMSFDDLLRHVAERSVEAYEHHYYPCTNLIEELHHTKDLSRPKLFSIMYGVQHNKTEATDALRFEGLRPTRLEAHREDARVGARFDLNLIVDQWVTDISFNFIYNTDLYRKSTVERIVNEMLHLIDEVMEDSGKPLHAYRLLLCEGRVLEEFNRTEAGFDEAATLDQLFERQASRTPGRVAVSFEREALSYAELNGRANRLARRLARRGVAAGDRVAILLEPSPDMLASVFAVLKLGACYVPLNPEHPARRVEHILKDAGVRCLITSKTFAAGFHDEGLALVNLDEDRRLFDRESADDLGAPARPEATAYVIYTSGTTGTPKGIPIKHRGVVNLLASTQREYGMTASDRVLLLTPLTFDASILDIFWPLAYGGAVVIPGAGRVKNPDLIGKLLAEENVTMFQCVPVMLQALAEARAEGAFEEPAALRLIICGGAAMTRHLRDLSRATFPGRLANHYGPTEVTVDATRFDCSQEFDGDVAPIGKPISNTKVFILDEHSSPVSINVVGEIHVESPGLTDGYLNDAEKTAAAFILKDFGDGVARRLYKTGDLGKFGEDGTIYFIGRKDNQVKVRGNRVELDEVTHALAEHPSIDKAVVKYVEAAGAGALVAFVELRESEHSFLIDGAPYALFTLSQRPELARGMNLLHLNAWPGYFEGDAVLSAYWPRLHAEFPEYQFGLTSAEDELAAVGNAVPIYWDGTAEGLPRGWDDALARAFDPPRGAPPPNTFFILTGIVADEYQGKGLSAGLLRAFKAFARWHGAERMLVAVRPTGKAAHPEMSFDDWCSARREDGQLLDNWLRIHERVGGTILGTCHQSQLVEGSLEDWRRWSGAEFSVSGRHFIPGALQAAEVNLEQGVIRYYDPSVWVEHHHQQEGDGRRLSCVDKHGLRAFLGARLPDYMIPEQYRFVRRMPLTDSGKIDERALSLTAGAGERLSVPPRTELQKTLVETWSQVLKVEGVGITDDFFDLGGQSLKVVQMLARVEEGTGVKVRLCDFYRDSTVRGLEQLIRAA